MKWVKQPEFRVVRYTYDEPPSPIKFDATNVVIRYNHNYIFLPDFTFFTVTIDMIMVIPKLKEFDLPEILSEIRTVTDFNITDKDWKHLGNWNMELSPITKMVLIAQSMTQDAMRQRQINTKAENIELPEMEWEKIINENVDRIVTPSYDSIEMIERWKDRGLISEEVYKTSLHNAKHTPKIEKSVTYIK